MGKGHAVDGNTENNEAVRKVARASKTKPPYGGYATGEETHDNHDTATRHTMTDTNIINLEDNPVKYDVNELRAFLECVFHADFEPDENIFTQLSKRAPKGFGNTPDKTMPDRLAKSNAPMRGYFSTSTLAFTDDTLRHTKTAFKRFHLVVLDDVGTKIPFEKIPAGLKDAENYRIETSESNFQLGFVLAEPITDYLEAQLLIDLFVDAGLTDGGGAMPCKKVRLPCGVNGKRGDNEMFQVKLCGDVIPEPWDVQELLDAAGLDVNWAEYKVSARDVNRRAKRIGPAAWSPDLFYVNPTDGVHDPVLEFLHKKGMVVQEAQENFMDIICPFHDMHTEKTLDALLCGYSPIGHGIYPHKRVFHCFHDACKNRLNDDFLDHIHAMGGPLMPAKEFAPAEVMNYVYDLPGDRVFNLRQQGEVVPLMIPAVNRVTEKVFLNGKAVDPLNLWIRQPSCLKVMGMTFDPTTRELISEDKYGNKRVNTFRMPEYPAITPDAAHVNTFMNFIEYLIPNKIERDYFIEWLACKVQKPSFRGAAIVLISQAQGTGKNTLMDMISKLFGENNTAQVSMDNLITPKSAFNDWATKLFVNVNESLATESPIGARRAYNKLKELVDPKAMNVTINKKHQPEYQAKCATSFLFFSNHSDAVYLQHGDRRFFAAQGPDIPALPEYFEILHKWLRSDDWMASVWNYMLKMPADEAKMMAMPIKTEAMDEVMRAATSPMEAVISGAIECWPSVLVSPDHVIELLLMYTLRGVPENHKPPARRILKDRLKNLRGVLDFNYRVQRERVKYPLAARDPAIATDLYALEQERAKTVAFIDEYDRDAFKQKVDDWLSDNGYDF